MTLGARHLTEIVKREGDQPVFVNSTSFGKRFFVIGTRLFRISQAKFGVAQVHKCKSMEVMLISFLEKLTGLLQQWLRVAVPTRVDESNSI